MDINVEKSVEQCYVNMEKNIGYRKYTYLHPEETVGRKNLCTVRCNDCGNILFSKIL